MALQDFHEAAGYLDISSCHNSPTYKNRCTTCGHRQAINGVPPIQSRELAMKNPTYVFTELNGRYQAKKQGKRNG